MRTMFALERIIPSKARRGILGVFLVGRDQPWNVRQLAKKVGISPSLALSELKNLEAAGILERSMLGEQSLYRANKKCEVASELKAMLEKELDAAEIIKMRLREIAGIRIAFIFGSYAKGGWNLKSDIDVFIIGAPELGKLNVKINELEGELGKGMDYFVVGEEEYRRKLRRGGFVKSVRNSKKVFLTGDENELKRLD